MGRFLREIRAIAISVSAKPPSAKDDGSGVDCTVGKIGGVNPDAESLGGIGGISDNISPFSCVTGRVVSSMTTPESGSGAADETSNNNGSLDGGEYEPLNDT